MLQRFFKKYPNTVLPLLAGFAAFGTYSCMYAFRKAFAAGVYHGYSFLGIDYKICLVLAQVAAYMLSKFIGIKYVSSVQHAKRTNSILLLIGLSWLALLGFALVPVPYNIVFLFLNGMPLGMIWGLVFSFLEGRRTTELMAAIMASSLVFASGFVKSVGRLLMQHHQVSEFWMPFATGAVFVLPLCLFVMLLKVLPPPDEADIKARSVRTPMTKADRAKFLMQYGLGLTLIVITYLLLTIVRDVRDNFEVEIWTGLGYGKQVAIFTQIDLPVAACVLVILSLLISIKDNFKAFVVLHYLIVAGCVIAGISAYLFMHHFISPILWMSLAGFGLYMAYIPYNSIYFERMIASFRIRGNVGFVMYIADAMGYMGSVGVLIYRQFGTAHMSWLSFFINCVIGVSILAGISAIASLIYFRKKRFETATIKTELANVI